MPPVIQSQRNAKYWGQWFTPTGDGNVKQTNLNIFYHLGRCIKDIDKLETGMPFADAVAHLIDPYSWLQHFVDETDGVDIPDTRKQAAYLLKGMDELVDFTSPTPIDPARRVTMEEVRVISARKNYFEKCFEREYRYLDVFTVTPKGIYDTRLLMTKPEDKFPERVRAKLPAQTLTDLRQAALCLAFDIPTACAFHICRATEALMLAYYEVLSGHPWALQKNRDWRAYIDHLVREGAPKKITDRLDEIRETDRNPYTHPEQNATLEEAPIQFELCTGVMYLMADEIEKKTP